MARITRYEAVDAAQSFVLDRGSYFGALLFSVPRGGGDAPEMVSDLWIVGLEAIDAAPGWIWTCEIHEGQPLRIESHYMEWSKEISGLD